LESTGGRSEMNEVSNWFGRLFPRQDQSFRQRFFGILVNGGGLLVFLELIQFGLSVLPLNCLYLVLKLVGTVVGVFGFTVTEYLTWTMGTRTWLMG
jgi:hypothetical protein